ncbi:hypothetical protein D5086_000417 [Populus alba]|uniref:Uncharacterized protein n=1 Tax=Populus alba TaxID=43335 RepID=A0ACC4CVV0_POPAL
MKYVCKGARAGPREELKQAKNLDDEANTTADLLADIDLSHNIKTEDDSNTITKNTTKVAGQKISAKSQLLETICCKEVDMRASFAAKTDRFKGKQAEQPGMAAPLFYV